MTARRRVMLSLLLGWLPASVWVFWIVSLSYGVVEQETIGYGTCGPGSELDLPGVLLGCDSGSFNVPAGVAVIVIMIAIAVAVAYGVARWTLGPVGRMADTVERLGPTSLGLRLRYGGPRDEVRRLADAVDAMLDRVAEGYQAQQRFASNASHELRTPLATQRALIEISLGSALTADQLDLVGRQLLATNERNERLIDGLLTLAETERGLVTSSPQPFDRIALDAVELLRPSAEQRKLDLTASLLPVVVRGEVALLDRLVTNLVQNAIKYNDDGGWVRVEVTPDAVLRVSNSGPVVPAEKVAGLFEPFRRMSGERLDHGGGVGLGLTIARSIVAAHQGEIDAYPNPDGGLTVTVRLTPLR